MNYDAMPTNPKPRVLVLYGGRSSEHAVSCVTAAGVLNALDRDKFEAVPVGITAAGQWTIPRIDPRTYSFTAGPTPRVEPTSTTVQLLPGNSAPHRGQAALLEISPDNTSRKVSTIDVVLPLLHGPYGEDGTLQGLLEMAALPYVGAGVLASAVAMDKHYAKLALAAAGLEVAPSVTITARQWTQDPDECIARIRSLTLPVFVKPTRAGSSNGVTRVEDWSHLRGAVESARQHDPKILVEEEVVGREIECAVLDSADGASPRASLPGEIIVNSNIAGNTFYDYNAKYAATSTTSLACPADLPSGVAEDIRRQSVLAFEALDGEGLARVDFFYTNSGRLVVNEVNTMPGFTPISMYPRMWAATGIAHRELITELIELALNRSLDLR